MTKRKSISFTKMSGVGNDFIVIESVPGLNLKRFTTRVCDRTSGIGADGVLVYAPSRKADLRMRIINADGSEAEMCGNGARCMGAYVLRNHQPGATTITMETLAGIITASRAGKQIRVTLSDPRDYNAGIPLDLKGREIRVDHIDTGVPHAVVFVDKICDIDVKSIGSQIRQHTVFHPRGANVNFVQIMDETLVNVRTYERGVEDETRACGTGSVAAAIISYLKVHPGLKEKLKARMKVRTTGGEILEVTFDYLEKQISNVTLKGSANFIAKGEYYV